MQELDERRKGQRLLALGVRQRRLAQIAGQASWVELARERVRRIGRLVCGQRRFGRQIRDHEVGMVRGVVEGGASWARDLTDPDVRTRPRVAVVQRVHIGALGNVASCSAAPRELGSARLAAQQQAENEPDS